MMNTRSIAAAVIVAVFASATALAVDPPKKAANVATAPVGVKIIPGLKFQSVRPKKSAQAILRPMRLPFGCSYGWGWSGGVEMSIWYKGTVPIQTEHLVVPTDDGLRAPAAFAVGCSLELLASEGVE